jgi:hypothetical protein
MDKEIDINLVLKNLREIIGTQAQEIAILKASIETANT